MEAMPSTATPQPSTLSWAHRSVRRAGAVIPRRLHHILFTRIHLDPFSNYQRFRLSGCELQDVTSSTYGAPFDSSGGDGSLCTDELA